MVGLDHDSSKLPAKLNAFDPEPCPVRHSILRDPQLRRPRRNMCGIHATIATAQSPWRQEPEFEENLRRRGPDHFGTLRAAVGELALSFTSTVLSLRGDHVARQPLVDESVGSVLCWNGECWGVDGRPVEGSDTEAILGLLSRASQARAPGDGEDAVLEALRTIQGPFAFIFFDKLAKRVYYGRDRLGRRSLLIKPGLPLTLSSIAEDASDSWVEVEADGCYTIELDGSHPAPTRHRWASDDAMVGFRCRT